MWQLHPEVESRPRQILIDKQMPGAFTKTPLGEWIESIGADSVCVAGYMTHMCCDTTARQAFHRGLTVDFLKDATGTLTVQNEAGTATAQELHNASLVSQQMFFSRVISAAEWMTGLSAR
jgi:nicotinamidase-related amidase